MPPPPAVLIVLATVAAILGWLASEFSGRRWLRIGMGVLAILSCLAVALLVGAAERFNSNAWFGEAAKGLVDATVAELEAGNVRGVLESLNTMQQDYRPTYENRARFDVRCEEAVARMRVRRDVAP